MGQLNAERGAVMVLKMKLDVGRYRPKASSREDANIPERTTQIRSRETAR